MNKKFYATFFLTTFIVVKHGYIRSRSRSNAFDPNLIKIAQI